MFPILQVGPLAIQTPGLLILIGVWVGLSLAERYAPVYKIRADQLYNLALAAMIAGVLGARLAYIARFPDAFLANPASLLSLNPGLLDPAGGLALCLLTAVVYGQRMGLPLWSAADALTPFFAVLMIALACSHLAAGSGFGIETDLPWGIELWGARRHPVQVYYALAGGLILAAVWPGRQRDRARLVAPGRTFLTYVALTSASQLFLDAFREDSPLIFSGLRANQLIAWLVLAVSLFALASAGSTLAPRVDERDNH